MTRTQSTDIFVHDRQLGTTERVSVDSTGAEGNGYSTFPSISADGRFVAFQSQASNLVAGDSPNGFEDIFVHDRQNATTERVSLDSSGAEADSNSEWCAISGDGRCVAFHSDATNLVVGDTNGLLDVFVHDRQSGMTERVSVDPIGAQGNMASVRPAISADGRFVSFDSEGSNLVAGDSNGFEDTFVRDRQLGSTERVSVDAAGAEGNSLSENPSISSDGRFVAFDSDASNLVAGDTNTSYDVLVRDRGALSPPPPPYPFCFGDASAGTCPCGNYGLAGRGCENSAATGGAVLSAAGNSSLASDTLALTSASELPSAFSIFLQGDVTILPLNFGDGLRCTGGTLKRLYLHSASGGSVSAPQPGDLSISARSAALGDTLPAGSARYYQTYYRDPDPAFCPNPQGNSWNVSSALSIVWVQ